MRTKTDRGFRSEKFAQKKFQCPFQVRDADILIHIKSFDLVKLRAVGGVHFIATIRGARSDHANRRWRGLHRANLDGRSVRAKQAGRRAKRMCPARFAPDDPAGC